MTDHIDRLKVLRQYADPKDYPTFDAAISALSAQTGEAVAWNDADVRDSAGYLPHPRELARAALTAAGVPELQRKAAELDALKARIAARIGDLKIESAALPVASHRGAAIDYCVRKIESLLPVQEGDDGH